MNLIMKVCINFTITQNNDFKYRNLENLTPDSQNIMQRFHNGTAERIARFNQSVFKIMWKSHYNDIRKIK